MKRFLLPCVLCILCSAMLCCTNSSEQSTTKNSGIVAQSGSITVTTDDLTEALTSMSGAQQFEYLSDEGRKILINMLIDWKLLSREGLKAGLDKDKAVKTALNKAKDSTLEREQILGSAYLRHRLQQLQPVSEEEIQDYFLKNPNDFSMPERTKISRILFTTQAKAQEALPFLAEGMAFQQYKELHPREKIDIDTLWLQGSEGKTEFETASFKLGINEISDIFSVRSGYYILRAEEKIPAKRHTIEEVRERLRKLLQSKKEQNMLTAIKQELRKNMDIEMNEELLENYQCKECDGRTTDQAGTLQ